MTTAQTEIQIHEFSTGIRPERTADGGWVSLGFTGQYMNATIDPIPHAVQRSIANKEFAVAEGATSDEPAIIGRVVSGEESDWSVVAVVTRGKDEKGRSASVYRYLLCEGDKGVSNIWRILSWIEDYQQSNYGEIPVFNPFDIKALEQPNLYRTSTSPQSNLLPETEASLISTSAPVLIPPEAQYTLQDLNRLANKKAITDENHQSVAWAYKVEALEQPGRFQIIHAASDRAYQLLERAIVSVPQIHAPVIDEQAFKAAIKGLINSSRVKLEYVQAITEPLGNTEIPKSYWKEIFDGQGANNALKQGIYSPQMVRLLTLRAIVIPETLVDFLAWLEKGSKQNENSTISAEFQSQIRNYLSQISATAPNIETKILAGIRLLLPQLLTQKVSVDIVYQLFTTANGLWAKFHYQVIQDIEHDLQLMSRFARSSQDVDLKLTEQSWLKIWGELNKYWQIRSRAPQEKFQAFAKLFEQLGYLKLSAIFYQICFGKVAKKIFSQMSSADRHCNIYGAWVEREVTILEFWLLTIIEIGRKEVPVAIVCLIAVITLPLSFVLGKFTILQDLKTTRENLKNAQTKLDDLQAQMDENITDKIHTFYSPGKTYDAIDTMATSLVQNKTNKNQLDLATIKKGIRDLIKADLSIDVIDEKPDDLNNFDQQKKQEVISWYEAIKKYQESKKAKYSEIKNVDGLIDKNGATSKYLQCEIGTKNQMNLANEIKNICQES